MPFLRRFTRPDGIPAPNTEQDFIQRFRLLIIEALHELTADVSCKVQLFLCFHALDEGVKLQRFGQVDQISQNQTIRAVVIIEMTDHLHVIFDKLKAELAEHVKGGVSAAKIVQPDTVPVFPEPAELHLAALGIGGHPRSVTSTMK